MKIYDAKTLAYLQGDIIIFRLHGLNCDGKESCAHVRLHVLVVQGHDIIEILQGSCPHPGIRALSVFTEDLSTNTAIYRSFQSKTKPMESQ